MTSIQRRFTLVTILFVVLTAVLFARAQSEDLIVNDPEVRSGVLANGLTYYVRANDQPSGMAELRLAVAAGSLQEDEDQLGLSHFLEHMLFNGTEKYPENELIDVLESFGMDFGPDINAYTTFDRTVYRLTVKSDDRAQFLTGLEILEQWAFKATLDEDQFEKERGVIQEEWRVGRGAQARLQDEIYPVLFQDSRYARRRPIGDMDIVMNAPLEALTRYYEEWYRPDLMAVIAVGDFDPDETVELIRERFGGHSNPKDSLARVDYPIPRHEETLVKVAHDPEATRTSVQLYVKYDPPEARFRPELRRDLAEQLFFVMLNQRLGELSRSEEAPFLYGYGFTSEYTKDTSLAGLAAAVGEAGVLSGLDALVTEAERVQRYGFLESELERAKRDVMSFFENYWKQRNDMDSADFIQSFIDAYFMGDSYPSVDWQWDAVQDLLPGITLEEVADVADVLLSDENRVVIVSGPSVPAITELSNEDILEVLDRVEGRTLDPWEESAVNGPLVAEPPAPGRIVRRFLVPGTDIDQWELSNGARVLVKKTDFRSDEILFRAISPGGSSRVDDENYISSQFASDAVDQGGLGEFSADNLRKALAGKNVDLDSFIQDTYEGFSGSTTPADLETLLQLLYLYQTDPRRDAVAWNALMNRTAESLRNRESSPMTLYGICCGRLCMTAMNGAVRSPSTDSMRPIWMPLWRCFLSGSPAAAILPMCLSATSIPRNWPLLSNVGSAVCPPETGVKAGWIGGCATSRAFGTSPWRQGQSL
jgi:zinc protease